MTPNQRFLVRSSWLKVFPHATVFTQQFYHRLFEIDPDLAPLFKSPMYLQFKKLFTALNLIVKGLDNMEKLLNNVQILAIQHASFGVRDKDYDNMGEALLWALEKNLGEQFNQAVKDAWATLYKTISDTMKSAAHESLKQQHYIKHKNE